MLEPIPTYEHVMKNKVSPVLFDVGLYNIVLIDMFLSLFYC